MAASWLQASHDAYFVAHSFHEPMRPLWNAAMSMGGGESLVTVYSARLELRTGRFQALAIVHSLNEPTRGSCAVMNDWYAVDEWVVRLHLPESQTPIVLTPVRSSYAFCYLELQATLDAAQLRGHIRRWRADDETNATARTAIRLHFERGSASARSPPTSTLTT